MKILVADDHALIREALRHLLQELDGATTVIEAADSECARAHAAAHPDLDLALLDLRLPGVNGLDLLAELRRDHPDLPIVVLSAVEDAVTMRAVLDRGAMGFIPKSSSNRVMLGALRLVLSGGRYLPPALLLTAAADTATGTAVPESIADLKLTERQYGVLRLIVQGQSNKQICRELGLAESTVKVHVTAILRALHVTSRAQAIAAINRFGWRLDPPDKTHDPAPR